MIENLKQRLTEIRNKLYDSMPKGQIDAFELTVVIANHLKELDSFIDNECEGNNQPDTENKCNKHGVMRRRYIMVYKAFADYEYHEFHLTPVLTLSWPNKSKLSNVKGGVVIAIE